MCYLKDLEIVKGFAFESAVEIGNKRGEIATAYCYGLNICIFHPNSYAEALTSNVTIFRDRACEGLIKVKWGHNGGSLIQ